MRPARSKPEIKSNTALRGIGALLVMVYHLGEIKTAPGEVTRFIDLGANIDLVLDMFFLLSGFIMAYIYAETFSKTVSGKSMGRFLWFRFARTYPVHIFALLIYLVERSFYIFSYAHLGNFLHVPVPPAIFYTDPNLQNTPFTLLANILLIHGVGVTSQLSWNYPSWTLSAEFAAYVVFPFLCLYIGRFGKIGAVIQIALCVGAYLALEAVYGDLNVPGYDGAIRCVPGFAIGVAIYTLSSYVKELSDRQLHVAQGISLAVLLLTYSYAHSQVLVMITLAVFVWLTTENRGWVSSALSWSPLHYLGLLSYSIYMTHVTVGKPVFPVLDLIGDRLGLADEWWWLYFTLAVAMGVTIGISVLIFRYVEMPARIALDRMVKRPAGAAASPATVAATSEPIASTAQSDPRRA